MLKFRTKKTRIQSKNINLDSPFQLTLIIKDFGPEILK